MNRRALRRRAQSGREAPGLAPRARAVPGVVLTDDLREAVHVLVDDVLYVTTKAVLSIVASVHVSAPDAVAPVIRTLAQVPMPVWSELYIQARKGDTRSLAALTNSERDAVVFAAAVAAGELVGIKCAPKGTPS